MIHRMAFMSKAIMKQRRHRASASSLLGIASSEPILGTGKLDCWKWDCIGHKSCSPHRGQFSDGQRSVTIMSTTKCNVNARYSVKNQPSCSNSWDFRLTVALAESASQVRDNGLFLKKVKQLHSWSLSPWWGVVDWCCMMSYLKTRFWGHIIWQSFWFSDEFIACQGS